MIINPIVIFNTGFHLLVIHGGLLRQLDLIYARLGVETIFEEVALLIKLLINIGGLQ